MGHCVFQSVVHPHRMFEPERHVLATVNKWPAERVVPLVCTFQKPTIFAHSGPFCSAESSTFAPRRSVCQKLGFLTISITRDETRSRSLSTGGSDHRSRSSGLGRRVDVVAADIAPTAVGGLPHREFRKPLRSAATGDHGLCDPWPPEDP